MNQSLKRGLILILIALVIFGVLYFTSQPSDDEAPIQTAVPNVSAEISPDLTEVPEETSVPEAAVLNENGSYTTKEDVALYLHQYGHLPPNYITKKEAQALGWSGGSLEPYAPGKCIGGSQFGNYEGLLPKSPGRTYTECDINTLGKSKRGAERIVFSNDGLIFYSGDHYESFELLYGEETP